MSTVKRSPIHDSKCEIENSKFTTTEHMEGRKSIRDLSLYMYM